jgi:hypothetical protein
MPEHGCRIRHDQGTGTSLSAIVVPLPEMASPRQRLVAAVRYVLVDMAYSELPDDVEIEQGMFEARSSDRGSQVGRPQPTPELARVACLSGLSQCASGHGARSRRLSGQALWFLSGRVLRRTGTGWSVQAHDRGERVAVRRTLMGVMFAAGDE